MHESVAPQAPPACIKKRRATFDGIFHRVCAEFNVREAELLGKSRLRRIARPRQVLMYLAYWNTNLSYPEIGRRLGQRNHTTVISGVKKVKTLRQSDEAFDARIKKIECSFPLL